MGLFDGLDDIEKIGGLEAANEQLKKDVVDWIMKTYFNDNSDIVCEIDESNGWFRVMRNGTLVITGDYVGLSIKVDDGNDKYATKEFVDKVKEICENKVKPSLVDINEELQQKLFFLLSDIPIRFGKQKDYEDYDDGQYLGLYCNKNNQREIILFEDAIMSVVNGNEEYPEDLIWKVIIHEYAHAMMDTLQADKLRQQDPKLYKYREESLANAFALKVLEKNIENFNKIENFVKSQSEEYRHGLEIYKREDLLKMMEFWREMKIEGNKRFLENKK
jgi:hypothetical protein